VRSEKVMPIPDCSVSSATIILVALTEVSMYLTIELSIVG
jgi:hypothetical protein